MPELEKAPASQQRCSAALACLRLQLSEQAAGLSHLSGGSCRGSQQLHAPLLPAGPLRQRRAADMANQTFAFANGTLVTTNAHLCVSAAPGRQPEAWDPGGAVLRQPQQAELAGIYALEAKSYPADEAATEEKLEFRLEKAPEYFRALYATQASHGALRTRPFMRSHTTKCSDA